MVSCVIFINYDTHKFLTTCERIIANGCNRVGKRYIRKTCAKKRPRTDGGNRIWNRYARKVGALTERTIANSGYSIPNSFIFKHRGNHKIFAIFSSVANHCAVRRCNGEIGENYGFGVRVATSASIGYGSILVCGGGSNSRGVTMTECGNDFLRYKSFITNKTMLTHSKAGFGAGRINCLVNDLGVTVCRNNFLRNNNLATNRTVYTLRKPRFCAIRSHCFVNNFDMTKSRNNVLGYKNLATTRTLFAFCQTSFSTSGIDQIKSNNCPIVVIVRKFSNGRCFKFCARAAITALFALFTFGGFFCYIPFSKTVSSLGNSFLCHKNFATNGAVLALSKTCFSTSGRNRLINNCVVTKSRNTSLFYKHLTTRGAKRTFCKPHFVTSRSYSL